MEKKIINLYKVIIASYLHDIGKLFVRAGYKRISNNFSVSHAEHLKNLFENGSKYIKENIGDNNDLQSKLDEINKNIFWKEVGILGSLHHGRDFSSYGKNNEGGNEYNREFRQMIFCIYMADNIGSFDRLSNSQDENLDKINFREQGLTSIFENILDLSDKKEFTNNFSYGAKTLEENNIDNIIPKNKKTNFKNLANDFLKDFIYLIYDNLDIKNEGKFKIFISKLDILSQKYFTYVPSDVYQGKIYDISLYDHTKLVVANSVVLFKKYFDSKSLDNLQYQTKAIKEETISLIAGDFPSIQSYIFDGIKKDSGISKRLRAKSLRVQLLNEAIIEYILDFLNLPRANVLINAGGKFIILSDNIGKCFNELNLKEKINSFLLKKFNGNIGFSLISKEFKIGELFEIKELDESVSNSEKNINIKEVFTELFNELSQDKFKMYSKSNLTDIFKNNEISGKILCKFCGQNYCNKIDDDENNDNNICINCEQEKKIGEKIVKDIYGVRLIYKEGKDFSYNEEILDINNFEKEIKKEYKNSLFIIFNKWEYLFGEKNSIISKSINLYVPRTQSGNTKDFGEIIKDDKSNNDGGLDYICMLKGDIDAMSLIFKHGFNYGDINSIDRDSFYSVNRLTQFSRFLELFFGTYLNKKIKEKFENIYTVFSGGDDFVFIVPFLKREEFIIFLYEEFHKFTGLNSKIHFSIGLGIFKDKTPFKTMDREVEKLLEVAKKQSKEKNKENLANKEKVLTYKGLTIYEENFTKVFNDENINFSQTISSFKLDEINNNKLIIPDTQIYKLYSELKRFRNILQKNKVDYSDAVLIGARILNMLSRNSNEIKKKKEFTNLKSYISQLIMKFEIGEDSNKTQNINNLLVGLVDNIYETRYLNK